jgi:hypothetical protein
MIRLPPKRQRPKMGVREPEQRTFPRHRKFVRSHSCCVPGCMGSPIDFHHLKTRGSGGGDDTGIGACRAHHAECHAIGISRFDAKYGVDLWALAAEFVRRSPDAALRAFLREKT